MGTQKYHGLQYYISMVVLHDFMLPVLRFWNVEILLHFNLAFFKCLLVFTGPLMGTLNFCWYLISIFYPACEIQENFMHSKITWFTVLYYISMVVSDLSCQFSSCTVHVTIT